MTIEELQILITAKTEGLRKELNKVKQRMGETSREVGKITSSMSSVFKGLAATIATLGIGAVFRSAKKDAMLYESSLQQINRMMGEHAKTFVEWSNTQASAFGLARSEAVRYGATYANLISGFSKTTEETTRRTQDLLKASTVVASGTGRELEDVMERIRSGLLGETDAIEDLGINVNVAMLESTKAFQQFANGRSWQQLSFQTQQTILYYGILEQAAKKYGNELAQNTATSQAMFIAQLKDAKLALGQAFLPIYNLVLPALTRMAAALATAMRYVAAFSQALFGGGQTQQSKATDAQAASVGGLGDAFEKAGKQAKGAVAGFDEVNTLADAGGGAGEVTGGAAAGPIPGDTAADTGVLSGVADAMEGVSAKAQEMATKVKEAYGQLSAFIQQHSDIIIAALAGVGTALAVVFAASKWGSIVATVQRAGSVIATALGAISLPITLIVAAVAGLTTAFVYFYRTNEGFRNTIDTILQSIGETASWLWLNVMVPFGQWLGTAMVAAWEAVGAAATWLWDNVLKPLGAWLKDVMPLAWEAVTKAAEWLWKNVLVPFGEFLNWLWDNVLVPVGSVLSDVLGVAFQIVAEIAESFWKDVLVPLGQALSEMFGPTVEAVSAVLSFLWNDVLVPLGTFLADLIKGVLSDLIDTFTFLWKEVLRPLTTFVGGIMSSVFTNAFNSIGKLIEGLKTAFIGLMNFITGVFTGDWEKAWGGVKDIFKGVFDSLWGIVQFPLNLIIDGINTLIRGLNSIKFDFPEWVPGLGGKSFAINIPQIPKLAKGGLAFGPTLAVVGDNRNASADPEVIAPLSKLQGMIASAVGNAFMTAVQMSGFGSQQQESGNGSGDIVINVDGTTIARVTYPYYQREQQRRGSAAIVQI
jgi:phage-related protein